jgi:hypothetical protein
MRIRDLLAAALVWRLFAPPRRPVSPPLRLPPAMLATRVPGANNLGCMLWLAAFTMVAFVLLMLLLFGPLYWGWFIHTIHQIVSLPSQIRR